MIVREAYDGLSANRESRHCSGVAASVLAVVPVGTQLRRNLKDTGPPDIGPYLKWFRGYMAKGEANDVCYFWKCRFKVKSEVFGPAVITRFPRTVHLIAEMCIWERAHFDFRCN